MTPMLLDTFHGRLRLVGALTTQTALHIGAGGSGDPLATDDPVVRTADGQPYIPGSSLKGVLRSAAEALFRGADLDGAAGERLWSCDPIAGKNRACVSHEQAKTIHDHFAVEAERDGREVDSRKVAEEVWRRSCTVCRLFGSLALAGRLRFADLHVRGEAPLFELRNGVGIDRDKELAAHGVLYDFEAVPPDTSFELRVTVDNPTDPEVGLLLYLFEQLKMGNLTLGGKTSRGLGRVDVDWETIEETTLAKDNPFASLLSSRDLLAPAAGGVDASREAGGTAAEVLPGTGDPETWRLLADLLRQLPAVDKTKLGERAAAHQLSKKSINQRLALGLDERHERRAWDVALERLAESGFLVREDAGYRLAGEFPGAAGGGPTLSGQPRGPELQAVIDRYVGAMARVWEEAR